MVTDCALGGSVLVVVPLVGRENVAGVGLVRDEDVVEGFASNAADDAFAVRVYAGSLWRTVDDLHLLGPKDGIERLAAQGLYAYAQVGGEIPRLLNRQIAGRATSPAVTF
ncbi:hypothetical protein GCM10009577_52040 [Streptomyces javensis]